MLSFDFNHESDSPVTHQPLGQPFTSLAPLAHASIQRHALVGNRLRQSQLQRSRQTMVHSRSRAFPVSVTVVDDNGHLCRAQSYGTTPRAGQHEPALLVAKLRRTDRDAADGARAESARIVAEIRESWPDLNCPFDGHSPIYCAIGRRRRACIRAILLLYFGGCLAVHCRAEMSCSQMPDDVCSGRS